jgi:hypothetical protein
VCFIINTIKLFSSYDVGGVTLPWYNIVV